MKITQTDRKEIVAALQSGNTTTIKLDAKYVVFLMGMVSALHIPEVADCETGKS